MHQTFIETDLCKPHIDFRLESPIGCHAHWCRWSYSKGGLPTHPHNKIHQVQQCLISPTPALSSKSPPRGNHMTHTCIDNSRMQCGSFAHSAEWLYKDCTRSCSWQKKQKKTTIVMWVMNGNPRWSTVSKTLSCSRKCFLWMRHYVVALTHLWPLMLKIILKSREFSCSLCHSRNRLSYLCLNNANCLWHCSFD